MALDEDTLNQAVKWARDSLAQGYSMEEVLRSMIENGYAEEDAQAVMNILSGRPAAPKAPPAGASGSGEVMLEDIGEPLAAPQPAAPAPKPFAVPQPAAPVAVPAPIAPTPLPQPMPPPSQMAAATKKRGLGLKWIILALIAFMVVLVAGLYFAGFINIAAMTAWWTGTLPAQ
jgi:hypothetical protein